jgi:predicted RNA binding protein YcfA (HicA-like mRNA interferase family)
MKNKELIRILKDHNFVLIRANGHMIYSNGTITIAVPNHMEHSKGLVRRLLTQAGLNKEEIRKYI